MRAGGNGVKIRQVASKLLYRGRVVSLTLDAYRAGEGPSFQRETIRHPASVVILPIGRGKRVLLIRQFRHAVGRYIYEIPAGTTEPEEPLLACAKRELAEETGFSANRWQRLTEFYPTPGISTERMVLYRATELVPLPKAVPKDPDEYITPRMVPARSVIEMVRRHRIIDAKSIIGVLFGLSRIRW
jgi:ADP-ribose pyrophosphatase